MIIWRLPIAEHGNDTGKRICMTSIRVPVRELIREGGDTLARIRTYQGIDRGPQNCLCRGQRNWTLKRSRNGLTHAPEYRSGCRPPLC